MQELTGIAVIKPGNIGIYRKSKEGQLFGSQVTESKENLNVLIVCLENRRDELYPKPKGDVQ